MRFRPSTRYRFALLLLLLLTFSCSKHYSVQTDVVRDHMLWTLRSEIAKIRLKDGREFTAYQITMLDDRLCYINRDRGLPDTTALALVDRIVVHRELENLSEGIGYGGVAGGIAGGLAGAVAGAQLPSFFRLIVIVAGAGAGVMVGGAGGAMVGAVSGTTYFYEFPADSAALSAGVPWKQLPPANAATD